MIYAFKNTKGEIVRCLNWKSAELTVVRCHETGRIHFVDDLEQFDSEDLNVSIISKIERSKVSTAGVNISGLGSLELVDDSVTLSSEVLATKEDEDRLPFFMKWTSISYAASLALLLLSSWIIGRYFTNNDIVVVQVVQQKRMEPVQKIETVQVSKKKITKRKVVKKASKRNVVARNSRRTKNPARIAKNSSRRPSPQNLQNIGALGALGGLSKEFSGAGGLNAKSANKSNSGLGYGGAAAAGGHERGLVGKGLVASGVGQNASVKGYGGYGTKGTGGGSPGYGTMKVGGSSSAFFQPLSEETLVEGGLDRDQINAVIQRNRGQVTYCYERGLQQDPSLSGRVEVKFIVDANGRVRAAQVANTSLSARKVEDCIVNKLRGWKFPTPVGNVNVRVTYPFLLQRLSKG